MQEKYDRWILYLVSAAFLIRLLIVPLTTISGDGFWHYNIAKFIYESSKIPLFEPLGRNVFWEPPLFHMVVAFMYGLLVNLGWGELSAKIVPPIFGAVSLILNYLIVRHLTKPKLAFYSTMFLSFLPVHVYLSTIMYMDTFFMALFLLAMYLTLRKQYFYSGIVTGLCLLTKYTAFSLYLILPILIYYQQKVFKQHLHFFIPSALIGSVWYVRNWLLLGNPVWFWFNKLFQGYVSYEITGHEGSLLHLVSFTPLYRLMTSFFGLPSGNLELLSSLPWFILILWLLGNVLFLVPILFGLKDMKKHLKLILVWTVPFILFYLVTVYQINVFYARYFFPIFPVIALAWSYGYTRINNKFVTVCLVVLCSCLVVTEFAKPVMASNRWQEYHDDFDWIKENVPEQEVIGTDWSRAMLVYHLDRYVTGMDNIDKYNVTYFVMQKGELDDSELLFKDDFKVYKNG